MFTTPAFAQAAGGSIGGQAMQFLPLVLIMVVFWFLLIRPQQKRAKEHAETVANIRKGDTVVTSSGMVGKVTKVIDDAEIMVEIAENTRVKFVKSMIADVRSKNQPVSSDK
jgi:preprotein translocase subunit YajC